MSLVRHKNVAQHFLVAYNTFTLARISHKRLLSPKACDKSGNKRSARAPTQHCNCITFSAYFCLYGSYDTSLTRLCVWETSLISLFLLLITLVDPLTEVKLDSQGRYLGSLGPSRVFLNQDGTYMAATQYHLWHWDRDGKLINLLGDKGEGPGEFVNLGEALWTGEHYWLVDASLIRSSIFSAEGEYLTKSPVYFRQFVRVKDRLLAIDLSRFRGRTDTYPPVLVDVNYSIRPDGTLAVEKSPQAWRKATEAQVSLMNNFKLLWVVERDGRFMVMDQLQPRIQIYDAKTLEQERGIADEQPYEAKFTPVLLRDFVPHPESWPATRRSFREMRHWFNAWSRITWFGALGADYAVAYTVPNGDDPESPLQYVVRVGTNGKMIGNPVVYDGYFMGIHDGKATVFYDDEQNQEFVYKVRTYDL